MSSMDDNTKKAGATLTIRLIKSFEYRTFKNVILTGIDLGATYPEDIKKIVAERIKTTPGFKPYLNNNFDSLKIYMKPHGAKTSNLIINMDHDDWFLDDSKTLAEQGIENETEISFFNRALFEEYKLHPEVKW